MVSATCFVDEFPVFIPKLRIMLVAYSFTNCLKPNITLFERVVVDYIIPIPALWSKRLNEVTN